MAMHYATADGSGSTIPTVPSLKEGDRVQIIRPIDYNGQTIAYIDKTYIVTSIKGDRVVVGERYEFGNIVVNRNNLALAGTTDGSSVSTSVKTEDVPVLSETKYEEDPALTSEAIERGLEALLDSSVDEDALKYSMRIFGIPHQFTRFCDYRTYNIKQDLINARSVGRTFMKNIMMKAPVLTILPGKPLYLPASQHKKGTTYALLTAANSGISSVVTDALKEEGNLVDKLRYYDFQSDYTTYMRYVNIMCAVAASFLDLNDKTIDGVPLNQYDWKNYRWDSASYSHLMTKLATQFRDDKEEFLKTLAGLGLAALNEKTDGAVGTMAGLFNVDISGTAEELDDLLTQMNFVQFYVSQKDTSVNENHSNQTAESKMAGVLDAGSDLIKEVAFLANSGGVASEDIANFGNGAMDWMTGVLTDNNDLNITGIMGRILSAGSTVIKGDNMIFPEIYQKSNFEKSYSFTIDLRTPYGNKFSYFLNVLVPLFHLLALAIPKQTTANTYGAPFLLKAYFPGVCSCNLGIVTNMSIEKNASGSSWTVDGFPAEMKVTLNISDLYSDLTMTPAGLDSLTLFVANSSLVEYIATNCGVNITTPQLKNRVQYMRTAIEQGFNQVPDSVEDSLFNGLEGWIQSMVTS